MTISEVSKKFDFSLDTLLYYEHIGLIAGVSLNQSGVKEYTEEECK